LGGGSPVPPLGYTLALNCKKHGNSENFKINLRKQAIFVG